MHPKVNTCLWIDEKAEEAVEFYVSLLPNSQVVRKARPSPEAPPVIIEFTIAGIPYSVLNASPGPEYSLAASICVQLETQEKSDALYDRLVNEGGKEIQCGWVTDAWGVAWQVFPVATIEVLMSSDTDANARAFAAMHQMKKINVAELRRAAAGLKQTD